MDTELDFGGKVKSVPIGNRMKFAYRMYYLKIVMKSRKDKELR